MDFKFDYSKLDNEQDPELQEILDSLYDAYDKLMVYLIHKQTGCKVEIVDDEHISIDGVVMDEYQFQDWLELNYPIYDYDDDSDRDPKTYDA